jgi:hypothetical protein
MHQSQGGAIMNRQHLMNLYDCINRIARKHEASGKSRSEWFYTADEFKEIKQDSRNTIL